MKGSSALTKQVLHNKYKQLSNGCDPQSLHPHITCIPYNMQNIFNTIVDIKAIVLKIIVKINTTTTTTTDGV